MYLSVGGYNHALGEVGISIAKTVNRVNGTPRATIERWTISGRTQIDAVGVQATDQAAVSTALTNLMNAYVDGVDFVLKFDDGTASVHKLISANAVGGTRIVTPPEFPIGTGAEYSTFRNWQAVVEAEYLDPSTVLVDWNETISFSGGGPVDVFLPTLNGPPVKQTAMQQSTYKATQSGSAVGLLGYPTAPAPLWPADEHRWMRQIQPGTPRRTGRPGLAVYTDFPIAWSYTFESVSPMFGFPSAWPA